jgi:hypothetical protein
MNIGYAMVPIGNAALDTRLDFEAPWGAGARHRERDAVYQAAVTAAEAGFNARASSGSALAGRKSIANQALELITASTAPMKNAACQ